MTVHEEEGTGTQPAAARAELAEGPAPLEGDTGGLPGIRAKAQGKGKGTGKAKGRGKGKAKGKCKGKAKAKGKARVAAQVALAIMDAGEAELPAPRIPKGRGDVRARLVADVGDRDINEVIAEAKAEVVSCETSVEEVTKRLFEDDAEIKREVEEASAAVEAAKLKEAQTLQKLRASQLSRKQVICGVAEAKEKRAEAVRTVKLLELERDGRSKLKDLEEAKRAAADAALAAKKALDEARAKEREVLEAQRAKEAEALQEVEKARRGERAEEKLAAKKVAQQIGDIERARAQRERAWRKKLLGLGTAATPVMIEDGPAEPVPAMEAGPEGGDTLTPTKRRAGFTVGPDSAVTDGVQVDEPGSPVDKRPRVDTAQ